MEVIPHVMFLYSGHHQGDGNLEAREALTFDTNLASMHTYLGGLGGELLLFKLLCTSLILTASCFGCELSHPVHNKRILLKVSLLQLAEVEDVSSDRFSGLGGAVLKLPMFYLEGMVSAAGFQGSSLFLL